MLLLERYYIDDNDNIVKDRDTEILNVITGESIHDDNDIVEDRDTENLNVITGELTSHGGSRPAQGNARYKLILDNSWD